MDSFKNGTFNFFKSDTQHDLELLTKALDASISGIVITDNTLPDNPIVYCNNAFVEMCGYDRNEIIGHNCRFLQSNDRDQPQRELLRDAISKGQSCVVDLRNYRKDGTLFYNNLYVSPVKGEDGNVQFFIGVQNNVTQRVKVELQLREQQVQMDKRIQERTQDLRENQDYLNSIVQTVRESLIVLDPNFKILSVNDHFIKVFKVTRNDTIGKEMYELGNGQWNIPRLRELLETVLPTNNPVEEFEVEHDFPRIGHKLMLLNAYRIELEGEYKDRILIAIEDITDRREIERRKDDFLSIASHELKTPLTTIKGYIHLMKNSIPENADSKFRAALDKTNLYVDRLNNLIAELLDVSRIQTGNIELHKEDFDFDKMVAETVEGLQTATKSHQIIVEGNTNAIYNGDESHIIQVVNNLLSNSIKYSPGSDKIIVHLSKVGSYIKLAVTDYGLGINLQDQKKIFERFYRVGEIQQHYPGMGIGLYVCDQIIKNHGGSIWVESEPGKGSTFSFTLPIH